MINDGREVADGDRFGRCDLICMLFTHQDVLSLLASISRFSIAWHWFLDAVALLDTVSESLIRWRLSSKSRFRCSSCQRLQLAFVPWVQPFICICLLDVLLLLSTGRLPLEIVELVKGPVLLRGCHVRRVLGGALIPLRSGVPAFGSAGFAALLFINAFLFDYLLEVWNQRLAREDGVGVVHHQQDFVFLTVEELTLLVVVDIVEDLFVFSNPINFLSLKVSHPVIFKCNGLDIRKSGQIDQRSLVCKGILMIPRRLSRRRWINPVLTYPFTITINIAIILKILPLLPIVVTGAFNCIIIHARLSSLTLTGLILWLFNCIISLR